MLITDEYLDDRLHNWAKWAVKCQEGLGYSPAAPEYNILNGGISTALQGGIRQMPSNPEAEEMDKFVCELRKYFLEKAEIIKSYYLHRSSTSKINDLIQKHNLPYREFYRELKNAKDMLKLLISIKYTEENKSKNYRKAA